MFRLNSLIKQFNFATVTCSNLIKYLSINEHAFVFSHFLDLYFVSTEPEIIHVLEIHFVFLW